MGPLLPGMYLVLFAVYCSYSYPCTYDSDLTASGAWKSTCAPPAAALWRWAGCHLLRVHPRPPQRLPLRHRRGGRPGHPGRDQLPHTSCLCFTFFIPETACKRLEELNGEEPALKSESDAETIDDDVKTGKAYSFIANPEEASSV
jgi:hypothetical protein